VLAEVLAIGVGKTAACKAILREGSARAAELVREALADDRILNKAGWWVIGMAEGYTRTDRKPRGARTAPHVEPDPTAAVQAADVESLHLAQAWLQNAPEPLKLELAQVAEHRAKASPLWAQAKPGTQQRLVAGFLLQAAEEAMRA
jgi:hypothetical protein